MCENFGAPLAGAHYRCASGLCYLFIKKKTCAPLHGQNAKILFDIKEFKIIS